MQKLDIDFIDSANCASVGIILDIGSFIVRRRYNVTSSLIGWAHTKTDPW